MHSFKRKRLIKSWIFSYLTIGCLVIVIGLLSTSVYKRYTVEREMAARRADAEAELQALRQRATALQQQVEYLEDERGIEAEIRNRFDVAKEGEQVVIIINDEESEAVPDAEPEIPKPKPWYQFW